MSFRATVTIEVPPNLPPQSQGRRGGKAARECLTPTSVVYVVDFDLVPERPTEPDVWAIWNNGKPHWTERWPHQHQDQITAALRARLELREVFPDLAAFLQ